MRLPHGYTNNSFLDDRRVTKHYQGYDAEARLQAEAHALERLAGHLPLPPLLRVDPDRQTLQTAYIPGRHGQELIDAGHAEQLLFLCGQLLRQLQALPPQLYQSHGNAGNVIVHGDFGPQNILIAPEEWKVAALLDWEWAHLGDPIEDLAWAEWIVRMHHSAALSALPALFNGYGTAPSWPLRHQAMLSKCQQLLAFVRDAHNTEGVLLWEHRIQLTHQFSDSRL